MNNLVFVLFFKKMTESLNEQQILERELLVYIEWNVLDELTILRRNA